MQLVIDSGNSFIKLSLFEGGKPLETFVFKEIKLADIESLFNDHPSIKEAIICSVSLSEKELEEIIANYCPVIVLDHNTPLPIKNKYKAPETIGKDRLAAAVGAKAYAEDAPVLVIDAGTCITYDIVNQSNEFLGGSISPGLNIRIRSLQIFTERLPLVVPSENIILPGTTTEESILSGVIAGIRFEMEGFINYYSAQYSGLKCVLSGGDMKYFDKNLKNSIFAVPNIVAEGLQLILNFNAKQI
ncbi:MAG: type III pantothenate kinase [Bacteroidota bacterium]